MSSQLDKNSATLAALVEYADTLPPASSGGEVTAESITEALGYTPADQAVVSNQQTAINTLTNNVAALRPKEAVVLQTLTVAEGDDVKSFRYDGKLRNFVLLVNVPAAAATVSGGAEISKAGAGGLIAYNYLGQIVHTTPVTFLCMSSECCGMDYVDFVFNNDTSSSSKMAAAKALNRTARVTDASIPFTRVSLYANSAFPAGTVIELRGVIADG